ncbi:MAG: MFS transporter [Paracoccaceae bacterium]
MPFLTFLSENLRWLFAGALLSFLSSFGQTFFISIFAGEIRAEFGLTNGEWGGIYTAGTAASALLMLYAGGLTDRFRVRSLGAVVLTLLALACLAMALNPAAAALPFVIFALRFAGQGMAAHVALVAMARWFVATRGKAMAVATFGYVLGEAILPLGFTALKRVVDWHLLWGAVAIGVFAVVPVLMLALRQERTPQSEAAVNSAPGMDGRHWSRREALTQPQFLVTMLAIMSFPALGTAFWFHQVHYAGQKGWEHLSLVAVFPLGTMTFMVSTAIFGWAIDRFGSARLMPVYLLPLALGFLVLSQAPSIPFAALGVILMGLSGGGQATLANACWAELFGTRHLGSIKATVTSVLVLGSALGPGMSGWLIDRGVAMPAQLSGYAAIVFLSSLAMVLPMRAAQSRLTPVTKAAEA